METLIEVVGWARRSGCAPGLRAGLRRARHVSFVELSAPEHQRGSGPCHQQQLERSDPSAVVNLIWIGIGAYA